MVQDQNSALTRHDTFSMEQTLHDNFAGVPIPPQSHLSCLLLLVLRVAIAILQTAVPISIPEEFIQFQAVYESSNSD